jgi:NAD(P)-dependent dehydrogenase (short-subunit alcohol dehydrogenase family)
MIRKHEPNSWNSFAVNAKQSKIALITGASKGIGRATALALAKEDVFVLAAARTESELKSLCKEISSAGGNSEYLVVDLTQSDDIDQLAAKIQNTGVNLKFLVHSAGVARVGRIADMNLSDWEATLRMNLTIPFLITQKCLPLMSQRSKIVFINSVAGRITFPEWAAYSASKYGLRALADTLRQEVQERGISVTSVYPSSVDTPMQDELPYNWDRAKMLSVENVARVIVQIYRQEPEVCIKEIDLENTAGTF